MKPEYSRSEVVSELAMWVTMKAEVVFLQRRPYSGIKLTYLDYSATRFSKVCWPDVWSETKGMDIATERAAFSIANTIYKEYRDKGTLSILYAELFGMPSYAADDPLLELVPQG